jgi:hypothetical protein
MEAIMKVTEHLLFLALMVPTLVLLVLAALSLAEPAHPSTAAMPQTMAAGPAGSHPVDERGYDGTY